MIVSHSLRFTFVHIHKAGGTSVEHALDPLLGPDDVILGGPREPNGAAASRAAELGLHKHSSVSDIERIYGQMVTEEYFLFSVVRHPVDRICSLYNFIGGVVARWARHFGIEPRQLYAELTATMLAEAPALTWETSKAFMTTGDFSGFIRYDGLRHDQAFWPQVSSLTGRDGCLKGEIFRLENRTAWIDLVARQLGIEFQLPHLNRSARQLIGSADLRSADVDYLRSRFAADFKAFGY